MKKLLFLLSVICLFSCEVESIENREEKLVGTTTSIQIGWDEVVLLYPQRVPDYYKIAGNMEMGELAKFFKLKSSERIAIAVPMTYYTVENERVIKLQMMKACSHLVIVPEKWDNDLSKVRSLYFHLDENPWK